ncbi:MAG: iron-containing alcohol dehydrogenase [Pseudomonadota bacterium]
MLPAYYDFHSPVKILSGINALENLPSELAGLAVSRPLVITDKGATKAGLIKVFKKAFSDSGMTLGAIVDDVPAPASCRAVTDIARVFRTNRCDGIIAVGGRSVINTAKGVAILVSNGSDDILAFAGTRMLVKPLVPVVVVPTASGSGAEVTSTVVIDDTDLNTSMSCTSGYLVPVMALLDPRMIIAQPGIDTAAAGMHALANAMDATMSVRRNPMSDAFAFAAIDLIRLNLIKALQDKGSPGVRLALANASVMAGTAFSNATGGVVHALSQSIGCAARIPWGVALAIILPLGLEYNLHTCEATLASLLLPLAGADEYARIPEARRALRLIECVRELQKTLKDLTGLPLTLKDAGVPEHMLETIAQMAVNDPSVLLNPRDMTVPQAMDLLNRAYA